MFASVRPQTPGDDLLPVYFHLGRIYALRTAFNLTNGPEREWNFFQKSAPRIDPANALIGEGQAVTFDKIKLSI